MDEFDRITHNPAVIGGKACIRGMRVTVAMILRQLAAGQPQMNCWTTFPTLSGKISPRQCVIAHGWRRSGRQSSFPDKSISSSAFRSTSR